MFLFHIPRSSIHDIPNSRATTSHTRPKSWLISSLMTARRNGDVIGKAAPRAALEPKSGNAKQAAPEVFRNLLRENRAATGIISTLRKSAIWQARRSTEDFSCGEIIHRHVCARRPAGSGKR